MDTRQQKEGQNSGEKHKGFGKAHERKKQGNLI